MEGSQKKDFVFLSSSFFKKILGIICNFGWFFERFSTNFVDSF